MTMQSIAAVSRRRAPWHLWAVAIATLLWDGSGAYTILLAQAGNLPGIRADEAAYYAAQPSWFVVATDLSLFGAIAAGFALLLRSGTAVWLFAVSLASILATNAYDLAAGTSRVYASRGAMIVTIVIVAIALLQLIYAWSMRRRGVIGSAASAPPSASAAAP